MAHTFHCTIVTPTEEAFDGDASYVSFPAWDGQYGMMKGLAPLLSTLAPGTLRIDSQEGVSRWYLIEGGFAHVDDGGLTLVTEGAISAEQLQLEEAQAELAEANARVAANEGDRKQVETRTTHRIGKSHTCTIFKSEWSFRMTQEFADANTGTPCSTLPLEQRIEALLFASERSLSESRMKTVLGIDDDDAIKHITDVIESLKRFVRFNSPRISHRTNCRWISCYDPRRTCATGLSFARGAPTTKTFTSSS